MKKIKKAIAILGIAFVFLIGYVAIANRNYTNMTFKQKFLKTIYPTLMWFTKLVGTNATIGENNNHVKPLVSFYNLKNNLINGDTLLFKNLVGKKILIVNTASDCGYTNQYEALQQLANEYSNSLIILGFPANDFKNQETKNDADIATFCKKNYGVTFSMMQKSIVVKNDHQNEVYQWLTNANLNGWNNKYPSWNFCKYLIDENGVLTHYFDPSISPLSAPIINAIKK
jgi:glutathione peroxidase